MRPPVVLQRHCVCLEAADSQEGGAGAATVCGCVDVQGGTFSGFLWDASSGVELRDAALLEAPAVDGTTSHSSPQLYRAHFTVSARHFGFAHPDCSSSAADVTCLLLRSWVHMISPWSTST